MTPAQLKAAADTVASQWPNAIIVKNFVGNIVIVGNDKEPIAYIDLSDGEVVEFNT